MNDDDLTAEDFDLIILDLRGVASVIAGNIQLLIKERDARRVKENLNSLKKHYCKVCPRCGRVLTKGKYSGKYWCRCVTVIGDGV